MTDQRDPNTPEPRGNYLRHADGRWNVLPLVLGALAIVVVGYMFLGDRVNTANPNSPAVERPVPKTN